MAKNQSKQLYIESYAYTLDTLKYIYFDNNTYDSLFKSDDFYIKKFIGSDWLIIGSGFHFSYKNNINFVFIVSDIIKNDFNYIIKYSITHINNIKNNSNINVIFSFIKNTSDSSTIVEFRLEYEKDSDIQYLEKYIAISLIKQMLSQICFRINSLFKLYNTKGINKYITIKHSFIIKKYYKDVFNFFYNLNNIAKSLETDKIWKIKNENENDDNINYKNFSIIIKNNIKLHYKVISLNEEKNHKIEIVYKKTGNSFPALNDYIKYSFFNIGKDICFSLYETHLPINISSIIFQICFNYIYYCNKKSKKYFENLDKNKNI
jgi:hypothetical protein